MSFHPRHAANVTAKALRVKAHLETKGRSADEVARLSEAQWEVVRQELGEARTISPSTRAVIVTLMAAAEADRQRVSDEDLFAGLG